jgi:hypothetical protein
MICLMIGYKVDGRLRFFDVVVDFDSGRQREGDIVCLSSLIKMVLFLE